MASDFARSLLASMITKKDGTAKTVKYTTTLQDSRPQASVVSYTYEFSEPIAKDNLSLDSLLSGLGRNIDAQNLGVQAAIMYKLGLSKERVRAKTSTKSAKVNYGEAGEDETSTTSIRMKNGRFMSQQALIPILEIRMKAYMVREMSKGAPVLVYRTGRFVNTSSIGGLRVLPAVGRSKKATLEVGYRYMRAPYSVFDPMRGNKLASVHRNPQRIIGEALVYALRDLVNEKSYTFSVREVI